MANRWEQVYKYDKKTKSWVVDDEKTQAAVKRNSASKKSGSKGSTVQKSSTDAVDPIKTATTSSYTPSKKKTKPATTYDLSISSAVTDDDKLNEALNAQAAGRDTIEHRNAITDWTEGINSSLYKRGGSNAIKNSPIYSDIGFAHSEQGKAREYMEAGKDYLAWSDDQFKELMDMHNEDAGTIEALWRAANARIGNDYVLDQATSKQEEEMLQGLYNLSGYDKVPGQLATNVPEDFKRDGIATYQDLYNKQVAYSRDQMEKDLKTIDSFYNARYAMPGMRFDAEAEQEFADAVSRYEEYSGVDLTNMPADYDGKWIKRMMSSYDADTDMLRGVVEGSEGNWDFDDVYNRDKALLDEQRQKEQADAKGKKFEAEAGEMEAAVQNAEGYADKSQYIPGTQYWMPGSDDYNILAGGSMPSPEDTTSWEERNNRVRYSFINDFLAAVEAKDDATISDMREIAGNLGALDGYDLDAMTNMDEDQIKTAFAYINGNNYQGFEDYMRKINYDLSRKSYEKWEEAEQLKAQGRNFWEHMGASITTWPQNVLASASGLTNDISAWLEKFGIDIRDPYLEHEFSNYNRWGADVDIIRGGADQYIRDNTWSLPENIPVVGGFNPLGTLYQGAMSLGDVGLARLAGDWLGGSLGLAGKAAKKFSQFVSGLHMFGIEVGRSLQEAMAAGQDNAALKATGDATLSAIFENIGLDKVLSGNLLKAAIGEGSEEFFTGATQMVWDALLNREDSKPAKLLDKYRIMGYASKAEFAAALDTAADLFEQFMSGFSAGGVGGVTPAVTNQVQNVKAGRTIQQFDTAQPILDLAATLDLEPSVLQLVQEQQAALDAMKASQQESEAQSEEDQDNLDDEAAIESEEEDQEAEVLPERGEYEFDGNESTLTPVGNEQEAEKLPNREEAMPDGRESTLTPAEEQQQEAEKLPNREESQPDGRESTLTPANEQQEAEKLSERETTMPDGESTLTPASEENAPAAEEAGDVSEAAEDMAEAAEDAAENPAPKKGKKVKVPKVSNAKLGRIYREALAKLDERAQDVLRKSFETEISQQLQERGFKGDPRTTAEAISKMVSGDASMITPEVVMAVSSDRMVLEIVNDFTAPIRDFQRMAALGAGGIPAIAAKNVKGKYSTANGQRFVPERIVSISDDGKVRVTGKTVHGEVMTVDADSIDFGINDGGIEIVADVAGILGRNADALLNNMQGSQDPVKYALAFKAAMEYGQNGRSLSSAKSDTSLSTLTESQIEIAHSLGKDILEKGGRKPKKNISGISVGNVDTSAISGIKLSKQQKASINAMTRLAKVVGFNVKFVKSKADADGKYKTENGSWESSTMTLTLDIHAGSNETTDLNYAMMHTAGHELTHFIKDFADAGLWNDYQEFVMDHLYEKMSDAEIEERIKDHIKRAEKRGETMTRDGALEEVIADASGEALMNITEADLRQIAQSNPTLFGRIKQFFKKWLSDLKTNIDIAYSGNQNKTAETKAMHDVVDQLSEKWNKMFVNAAQNRNVASKATKADARTVSKQETVAKAQPLTYAHIDARTEDSVRSVDIDLFCNEVEEAQVGFAAAAKMLLHDVNNSISGQKFFTGDGEVTGQKRQTSDLLARMKDETNWTWDNIRKSLQQFADMDDAAKGYPVPKNTLTNRRMELYLDEVLTEGYTTLDGMKITQWGEYVEAKAEYKGSKKAGMNYRSPANAIAFEDYAFADAGDVKYSERLSVDEVESIQAIGEKSINAFSSTDIKKTEALARRYFREMGTKSPFFRSWFGDWRAYDTTPVKIANKRGDARGAVRNDDTGWDIQVSSKVFNETKVHERPQNQHAISYLPYIEDIIKKAVMLDSSGIRRKKSINSLLMHSLYGVVDVGNGPELVKLFVEEMNNANTDNTSKRAWQLQSIEKRQLSVKGSGKALASAFSTADVNTIADLVKIVKMFGDLKDAKPVNEDMLNEDGTPKVMYHGTPYGGFTVFKDWQYFTDNQAYADVYHEPSASSIRGRYNPATNPQTYAVYLSVKKPFDTRDPKIRKIWQEEFYNQYSRTPLSEKGLPDWTDGIDLVEFIEDNDYDFDAIILDEGATGGYGDEVQSRGVSVVVRSSNQIKSATDNIGTFDPANPDIRYSNRDASEYDADSEEFSRMYDEYMTAQRELREATEKYDKAASDPDLMDAMMALVDFKGSRFSPEGKAERAKLKQAVLDIQDRLELTKLREQQEKLSERVKNLKQAMDDLESKMAVKRETQAIEKSGLSEAEYFRKQAVKEFGYTPHFVDAGYMLPNGKMLNFSGEKGKHFGTRGQDHRAIGVVYERTSGHKALTRFMNDGNIRVMAESPGIDISGNAEPTAQQYANIKTFVREYADKRYFNVDISDNNGRVIGSLTYEGKLSADKVVNDIKHYFATGEFREQSMFSEFRYQERNLSELSDRELLANAVESVAQNDTERDYIKRYKKHIAELNEKQLAMQEAEEQIRELKAEDAKGNRDEIIKLQNKVDIYAKQISRADAKLLDYEATKPIKDMLTREKAEYKRKRDARAKEQMARYRENQHQRTLDRIREVREAEANKRKAMRERADERQRKAVEHAREVGQRKVDRMKESQGKEKYRAQILQDAKKLYGWVVSPTNKGHVPEMLKRPLGEFLESIDFSSARSLKGGEATRNDRRMIKALDDLRRALSNVHDQESLDKGAVHVAGYVDLPSDYLRELDALVGKIEATLDMADKVTDTPFMLMTSEQLHEMSKMFRILNTSISKMNTVHENAMYESNRTMSGHTIDDMTSMTAKLKTNKHLAKLNSLFNWKNATPYYAFQRLGRGGKAIFDGFQNGWDKMAQNSKKLIEYAEDAFTSQQAKSWSKDIKTIELDSGEKFQMTASQAMSLYCLSKRDQAIGHLMGGGIRISDIDMGKGNTLSQVNNYILSEKDISRIIGTLTAEQKAVADKLQKFLNTVCSDWGNEISMKRFGYKMFTEEFYFPIETDANNRSRIDDKQEGKTSMFRLLNMSAMKQLTPNANNAIIIRDIFDVFSNHATDIAKYNAMALPILDFIKWYNYVEKSAVLDANGKPTGQITTRSVQKALEHAYGQDAKQYMLQFIRDINGEHDGGRNDDVINKLTNRAKTAAVGANLRVYLLQLTSLPRAAYAINPVYLARSAAKIKNYAPGKLIKGGDAQNDIGILKWKNLGFYSTDINNSVRDMVRRDQNVLDKVREWQMAPAGWMDNITGNIIYEAVKLEMADKHPNLKPGTEAYKGMLNKRVREIVYKTQVVDSTMTRSELMRSKGIISAATAFMSEPTLTVNMLNESLQEAIMKKRGAKLDPSDLSPGKKAGRAVAVFLVSATVTSIVGALADAFRDDDDYEEFEKKYLDALKKNAIDNVNIFGMIPIIKEVSDVAGKIIKGQDYKPNTLAVQVLTSASNTASAIKDWNEGKGTLANAIFNGLKTGSYGSGVGVYNAVRDIASIYNTFFADVLNTPKIQTYADKKTTAAEAYYDALQEGDAEKAEWILHRAKINGYDVSDFSNKITERTKEDFFAGKIDAATAEEYLVKHAGKKPETADKSVSGWAYEQETGSKFDDMRDDYIAGTVSKAKAKEYLSKYGGKDAASADEQIDRWDYYDATGASEGYTKYWRMYYALENNGDFYSEARRWIDSGMKKGDIARSIAGRYKSRYLAIKGTAEGEAMLEMLLDLYEAIGYDRDYERNYINNKWTDD